MSFRIGTLVLLMLVGISTKLSAQKIEKGLEALKVFNFATAKEVFDKNMKKNPAGASFGFTKYYLTPNTPFFNLDSARFHYQNAKEYWATLEKKDKEELTEIGINDITLGQLYIQLSQAAFELAKKTSTLEAWKFFLKTYPEATQIPEATSLRDQLAFQMAKEKDTWEAYQSFYEEFPEAKQKKEAFDLYELRLFSVKTQSNIPAVFDEFIKRYPENSYMPIAKDSLYKLATATGEVANYISFIRTYPDNPNVLKAWEEVYHLSIDFTPEGYESFLNNYSDYPHKSAIEEELALSKLDLLVIRKDAQYGYCGWDGKVVVDFNYDNADPFINGLARVYKTGKYGFITKSGKEVIPPAYEDAEPFQEGLAVVKLNGKYGAINPRGILVVPCKYEELEAWSEGLAPVQIGDYYGYLDKKGKLSIPARFEAAEPFNNGLAMIKLDGKYGFINRAGQITISCAYDWAEAFSPQGLARIRKNEKFGKSALQTFRHFRAAFV